MRTRAWFPLFFIALVLIPGGCATGGSDGARGSGDRLTAEEIAQVEALTAYEAIQIARPRWLVPRTLRAGDTQAMGSDRAGPVVYLDGVRIGTVEELTRIRTTVVAMMQYLSPSDATNRFGTNHDSGAILVTTR